MRPLIAIHSCSHDILNGRHQAIRDTWLPKAQEHADVRFFVGRENEVYLKDDEVQLYATEDASNLVDKEAGMLHWAVRHGYERILKTETDVYINPTLMFNGDIYSHDVIGRLVGNEIGKTYGGTNFYAFMQGHAVWYSQRAAIAIAENLIRVFEGNANTMSKESREAVDPTRRSADLWSAMVYVPMILDRQLTARVDWTYGMGPATWHYQGDVRVGNASYGKQLVPEWLRKMHEENS